MTEQTVKCRLVNFEGLKSDSSEQLECHKDAFNSFMLKISELEQYEEAEKFTECIKCQMILTDQDKSYLDDWYMVRENRSLYPTNELSKMESDPWKYYFWNCRFCGNRNLIQKSNTFLAKNRSKVILNEGLRPEDQKRYCDDPILLFLIDNSSSMEEEIGELNDEKKLTQEINKILNNSIKSTQIYKKITQNQEKKLRQINQQFKKHCHPGEEIQRQEYKDHLNKYKVLMALTENSVNQICGSGGTKTQETLNLWDTKEQKNRKIGFMFFNSDVILQKNFDKSAKIIKVSDRSHFDQIETSSDLIRVDFENFDNLYRIGKENSQGYGSNISTFKFKDIEVRGMDSPQGQTALGPALTIASGIVNNYGPGSSIVVVTDGQANKGIFSSDGVYKKDLQQLKYRLQKAKAELCLIRLGKKEEDKNEIKSDLQKFFSKQTKIVVVPLDLKQSLDLLKNKIKALVDNSVKGKTYTDEIRIKSQNSNVSYENSLSELKKKLFKNKQKTFFSAKISEPKLIHRDYRYPFMTQVVVKYIDIESRRSSHFMCYMIQKLIKYSQIKKQDQQLLDSTETLNNVLSYISSEGEKIDIDRLPIYMQSFRTSIMHSMSMSIDKSRRMEQMQFEEQFFPKTFLEDSKRNFTLKEKLQTHIVKEIGEEDEKL